jgi:hypothetical protein
MRYFFDTWEDDDVTDVRSALGCLIWFPLTVTERRHTGDPTVTPMQQSERMTLRGGMTWSRVLWWTVTLLLVTMVAHVVALVVTGGPVTGPVSLRKPATFAEAGWLIAWPMALILPTLRTRPWQRLVIGASTLLFTVGETAIMGGPPGLAGRPQPRQLQHPV